jgi:hypothetical protein
MNLPQIVEDLVNAQNNHDSAAYTACFSDTAVVFDEGKTHKGKAEIQKWTEHTNAEYATSLKPVSYKDTADEGVLTAEVSGTFPGSPAVLQFHLALKDGLINSLSITG